MQIQVDKVQTPPFHALSRTEVRTLLQAVPPEWLQYVREVHLSATLEARFRQMVSFDLVKGRLTVRCRYATPERARQEILREIASHTLGLDKWNVGLSNDEWRDIDRLITPVLERVQSTLSTSSSTEAQIAKPQ